MTTYALPFLFPYSYSFGNKMFTVKTFIHNAKTIRIKTIFKALFSRRFIDLYLFCREGIVKVTH